MNMYLDTESNSVAYCHGRTSTTQFFSSIFARAFRASKSHP